MCIYVQCMSCSVLTPKFPFNKLWITLQITGSLVKKKIGVDAQYIHSIALNTPTVVENVEITFLEANQ